MKFRQGGIILLMVLLLLGIVSALIVTQLEMVLLHQKATQQFLDRQQVLYTLEQAALQLRASSVHLLQSNCTIAAFKNPNHVIAQFKTKHTCTLTKDKMNYIYLIEDLGIQPCLQTMVKDVPYSTRHWRLTIAQEITQEMTHEAVNNDYLQIRVAELTNFRLCPTKQVLHIKPGLVSWRFWSVA